MENKTPDLSSIMEMLSKNPDILKGAGEMFAGMSKSGENSGENHEEKREYGNGEKLIDAIKPYLSPSRQRAVEAIKKFGNMGDIMKMLNLRGGGGDV